MNLWRNLMSVLDTEFKLLKKIQPGVLYFNLPRAGQLQRSCTIVSLQLQLIATYPAVVKEFFFYFYDGACYMFQKKFDIMVIAIQLQYLNCSNCTVRSRVIWCQIYYANYFLRRWSFFILHTYLTVAVVSLVGSAIPRPDIKIKYQKNRRFSLSRFLLKTLRVNEIAVKSFSKNRSFGNDVKL